MQHDIYSLGVVLLEIGLWTSFVAYDQTSGESRDSTPTQNSILGSIDPDSEYTLVQQAIQNKARLEHLAENELPSRLGKKYTNIVLQCLRVLDFGIAGEDEEKGEGFGVGIDVKHGTLGDAEGKPWIDEDGVVIGVRYIENFLMKMQEINV